MEEKKADALEMAAQEDKEREKVEKAAQKRVRIKDTSVLFKFPENYINKLDYQKMRKKIHMICM